MDSIALFMTHLDEYVSDHNLPMDITEREDKCREEDIERMEAYYLCENSPQFLKGEVLDRIITGLLFAKALGIKNPLMACYDKLRECRNRPEYKALRGEK